MQLQEPSSSSSAPSDWAIGTELVSLLQLSFFLVLGYGITRAWIWSKSRAYAGKACPKKIDDVVYEDDQASDSPQAADAEEPSQVSLAGASKAAKTRQNNAKERRKARKSSKLDLASPTAAETDNRMVDEPVSEPSAQDLKAPVEEAATSLDAPVETDEAQVAPSSSGRQSPADSHQPSDEPVTEEPPSAEVSERVAKIMAKKMERKARKALEAQRALEEQQRLQEQQKETQRTEEPEPEKPAGEETTYVLLGKDSGDLVEEAAGDVDLICERDVESPEKMTIRDEQPSFENTDVGSTPEGISTPEQCLSPRDMNIEFNSELGMELSSTPVMWMPQIEAPEGWMAVAVPLDNTPGGVFDGRWRNATDEEIEIRHTDISFQSGTQWIMQVHSMTEFSVQIGDEEFRAELDSSAQKLHWTDGDVWTYLGQLSPRVLGGPQTHSAMMPVIWPGDAFCGMAPTMLLEEAPAMGTSRGAPNMPQDAQAWEICWDWKKKGWCPRQSRGEKCEWYHPCSPSQPSPYCKPCPQDMPFSDVAF